MARIDEFGIFANKVKSMHKYVAVCRAHYEPHNLFYVVFKSKKDLVAFINNIEDCKKFEKYQATFTDRHFYAQAFANKKFIEENT